jgi:thymidine phosphorylase
VAADREGYVIDVDAEKVGVGAMRLGAGRNRAEDDIDHAVGVMVRTPVGARVRAGDPVLQVHYRDDGLLGSALPLLRAAVTVGDEAPTWTALVLEEVR